MRPGAGGVFMVISHKIRIYAKKNHRNSYQVYQIQGNVYHNQNFYT